MHIPFDKFNEQKAEELAKVLLEKKVSYFYACTQNSQVPRVHQITPGCELDILRITKLRSSVCWCSLGE